MSLPDFYALGTEDQEFLTARWESERDRCATHAGPRWECADPEKVWYPQRAICHAAMEEAAANWRYEQLHKDRPFHDGTFPEDPKAWSQDRSSSHPYHYRDGVRIWVAPEDLAPGDDFLRRSDDRGSDGETDSEHE